MKGGLRLEYRKDTFILRCFYCLTDSQASVPQELTLSQVSNMSEMFAETSWNRY